MRICEVSGASTKDLEPFTVQRKASWGRNYNSSFFFPTLSWSLSLRVRMKVVNPDSWFWRKKNMGHVFTNKANQCIRNTLSFCIPAEYKLRSSCLVSLPQGRIETREQSLLLLCLIVPCSAPVLLHCKGKISMHIPRVKLWKDGTQRKGP